MVISGEAGVTKSFKWQKVCVFVLDIIQEPASGCTLGGINGVNQPIKQWQYLLCTPCTTQFSRFRCCHAGRRGHSLTGTIPHCYGSSEDRNRVQSWNLSLQVFLDTNDTLLLFLVLTVSFFQGCVFICFLQGFRGSGRWNLLSSDRARLAVSSLS